MLSQPRIAAAFRWQYLPMVALVALKLALHLYANRDYGFLRDELAYIDDGKHLALGYVDHPPLVPFFAAAARLVWGDSSLLGLRLWPALCSSALLAVTMQMAREFGGGRLATLLAGLAFIAAPIFLASAVLFQTVTFDLLWWGLASLSFVRLVRTHDERWWLAIGVFAGLGMLTKYTVVFYAAGFALALLVTRDRRSLLRPWPWLAVAIATCIAVPNIAWQVSHSFISLDYTDAINQRDQSIGRTDSFLPEQLLLLGPPAVFVWGAGLAWLLRARAAAPYRVLGWTFLFTVALFVLSQGRGYYTAAVYPPLMAAGGVAFEGLRPGRLRTAALATVTALLVAGGVFAASVSLPVAPVGSGYFEFASGLNEDLPEMVGWPELVETIAAVRDELPEDERDQVAVLAGNFGLAGAVNLYGPRYELPEAISPVNTYYYWSEGRLDAPVYLVVGFSEQHVRDLCRSVEVGAVIRNREGVGNDESGGRVYICRDLYRPLPGIWPALRRFG